MKCEKCGAEMNYFQRGSNCGHECPNCGWGLVTTYINPINEDSMQYELNINPCVKPSVNGIKTLSHAMGIGFVAAKEMLEKGGLVKTGRAKDIVFLVRELRKADVVFTITPEFPYE